MARISRRACSAENCCFVAIFLGGIYVVGSPNGVIGSSDLPLLSETDTHIDGEPIMLDSILDIKCRRGQLKIFTPDNRADFRPIITPVKEMLRDARLGLHHLFSRHILAHLSPDDEADLF